MGRHTKIGKQHTETRNRVTRSMINYMQGWVDDVKHGLGPRMDKLMELNLTDE